MTGLYSPYMYNQCCLIHSIVKAHLSPASGIPLPPPLPPRRDRTQSDTSRSSRHCLLEDQGHVTTPLDNRGHVTTSLDNDLVSGDLENGEVKVTPDLRSAWRLGFNSVDWRSVNSLNGNHHFYSI